MHRLNLQTREWWVQAMVSGDPVTAALAILKACLISNPNSDGMSQMSDTSVCGAMLTTKTNQSKTLS